MLIENENLCALRKRTEECAELESGFRKIASYKPENVHFLITDATQHYIEKFQRVFRINESDALARLVLRTQRYGPQVVVSFV